MRFLALAAMFAATSAQAAILGTVTNTNAQHVGRRGVSGNTMRIVTLPAGTIRSIDVAGTLTSTNPETWGKHLRVQPTGNGLAGGQTYFQFTETTFFNGTIPASARIVVPGGMAGSTLFRFEHYSPDSEAAVPGLDGTSTLTYTFNDSFDNGALEFSDSLDANHPTFNRLTRFFDLEPSGIGTNVFYDAIPFHVDADGLYTMAMAAGFNSHLTLYAGTFDPANPLAGGVEVNDEGINVLRRAGLASLNSDIDTTGTSRLDMNLLAGVQYYFVASTFDNGQTGNYFGLVTGAGRVTAGIVPEPATLGVLAGISILISRRR